MNRRGFLAGLTGSLASLTGAAAETPALERLTLFIPSTFGDNPAGAVRALEQALMAEKLVAEVSRIHAAGDPMAGLQEFVSPSPLDGDMLMVGGPGLIGAGILGGGPIELAMRAPIARLITENLLIAVHGDSDVASVKELTIALRLEPTTIDFVGGPLGSTDHLLVAKLARFAGIDPRRVRYSERPAEESVGFAVYSGRAGCAIGSLSEMQADISLGRLRPLAISSTQRVPGVNIPTFLEMGVDLQMDRWRGLFASPDAGPEQQARLAALAARLATTTTWKSMIFQHNWTSAYQPMPAFGSFVQAEIARIRRQFAEFGLT